MIASDLETTSCDEVRIIEINATPGIGGHVQLLDFDSAAYVIDRLFFS